MKCWLCVSQGKVRFQEENSALDKVFQKSHLVACKNICLCNVHYEKVMSAIVSYNTDITIIGKNAALSFLIQLASPEYSYQSLENNLVTAERSFEVFADVKLDQQYLERYAQILEQALASVQKRLAVTNEV